MSIHLETSTSNAALNAADATDLSSSNCGERVNYFNYFTEIEDAFVRRRGKNLLLSPLDWAMIEDWKERGVPLHVVIRGIETVFDGFDKNPRPRSIKGLIYCREEVEAQFQEWTAMQAGRSEQSETPGESGPDRKSISRFIGTAIEQLARPRRPELDEELGRAIARLSELRSNMSDDLEVLDKALCDIERVVDDALLRFSDADRLAAFRREIDGQLRVHRSAMEADAYRRTYELMLLKKLRDAEDIPRLGLFYL